MKKLILKICAIQAYFIIMHPIANILADFLKRNIEIDTYKLAVIFEILIYFIVFIPVFFLMKHELKDSLNTLRKDTAGKTILLILIGCIVNYILNIVGNMITMGIVGDGDISGANQSAIIDLLSKPLGALLIPVFCVIGPIVEELIFRGAIQSSLEKFKVPRILCVFIAAFLFGMIHITAAWDWEYLPSYMLSGLAFGFMFYFSKNIYVCISMHIILNCIATWSVYSLIISDLIGKL